MDRLEALGFKAFVRTTGGKGLHVVVTLVRWDELKSSLRPDCYTVDSLRRRLGQRSVPIASSPIMSKRCFTAVPATPSSVQCA